MNKELLKISSFAEQTGSTPKALRLYEKRGLIRPAHINEKGYRFFSPEQSESIQEIKKLQGYGFTLSEIQDLSESNLLEDSFGFRKSIYEQYKKNRKELDRLSRRHESLIRILEQLDSKGEPRKLTKHDKEVFVETKTMMQQTCEDNNLLGKASWAILDGFKKSGAKKEEIGSLVDMMNKYFPKLNDSELKGIEDYLKQSIK